MAVLVALCLCFLWLAADCIDCQISEDCRCTAIADCELNCSGKDYCKGSIDLQCKAGFPCTVRCEGEAACQDANIDGSAATDVVVICSGVSACKGSGLIRCGSGDCLLHCASTDACQDTSFYCETAASFRCTGTNCHYGNIPVSFTASPTGSASLRPTKSPTLTLTPLPSNHPSQQTTFASESWWAYAIVVGAIVCCFIVSWIVYVRLSFSNAKQRYLQKVSDGDLNAKNDDCSSSDGEPSTHDLIELINHRDDDHPDDGNEAPYLQQDYPAESEPKEQIDRRSVYSEGHHKLSIGSARSEGVIKVTGNDGGVDDIPNVTCAPPDLPVHANIGRESFIVNDSDEEKET